VKKVFEDNEKYKFKYVPNYESPDCLTINNENPKLRVTKDFIVNENIECELDEYYVPGDKDNKGKNKKN